MDAEVVVIDVGGDLDGVVVDDPNTGVVVPITADGR
jgi:hypothetical protein